jgi:hypothetical protein
MPLLKPGEPFPPLTMNVLSGGKLTIPDAFHRRLRRCADLPRRLVPPLQRPRPLPARALTN